MNPRNFYAEQCEVITEFFTDELAGGLCKDGQEHLLEAQAFQKEISAIYAEFDQSGFGLTLANAVGDSWAIVLPDASAPGQFRYQTFKSCGWTGHFTCQTADVAILEAFQSGYRCLGSRATLDQLASKPAWAKGMEQCELIRQHNVGSIDFAAFNESMRDLSLKYGQAA